MGNRLAIQYYNDGLQQAKEKKWDAAIDLLRKAILENPRHVNSYNVLGKAYMQKGKLSAAKRSWRKALRIDPYNVTARQCLDAASIKFTFAYLKAMLSWSHIKDSVRLVESRTLVWPAVVIILLAALIITNSLMLSRIRELKAGMSKAETNEGPPPVKEVTRLETSLDATEAYHQGLAACMSEQYDQAIEKFQQVLAYPPSHQMKDNAQYWLAECYYAQADYTRALDEFERVKKYFPKAEKVFDAELKIAYTYYRMGQIETARQKISLLYQNWPDPKYRSSINVLQEQIQPSQAQ